MLKAKTAILNPNLESAAKILLAFLSGIFLSDAKICGTVSFVNISISGAVSPMNALAVLVGSLLKYVATSQVHKNVIIICAMTLICIGKLIFNENFTPKFAGICTGISTFASGLVVALVINENFIKILFYLIYSVLAGFTSFFFKLAVDNLKKQGVIDLKSAISCAYAIVFVVLIATLAAFDPFEINLGRLAGIAITLIAAKNYGYMGGVLCGALTTCGVFLSSSESGMPVVLLSVAGLLTGYLYKNTTAVISAFFISINVIFTVLIGFPKGTLGFLIEIGVSIAIFAATSQFFSDKWIITGKDEKDAGDVISSQMIFLADSISAVRNDSKKISEHLRAISDKTCEIETTSDAVCSHCSNRLVCWYNKYDATRTGFKKMSEIGDPTVEKLPYELKECINKEKIVLEFAKSYREKITAKLMALRLSDSQKMLYEQIKITEELLASAGERLDIRYSPALSKTIASKLEKYGFNTENVSAYYNSQNRLLMELYFSTNDSPKNCQRICDIISDEINMKIDCSEPVKCGKNVRMRAFEKTEYRLDTYCAAVSAENSGITGDCTSVFSDGLGNSYVILSDGMGCGKTAALESRMVVSMFKRLIISGAEYSSAIKLINSIMLTKSQDEAFATLDAVRVNLDDCRLTLIKSGASATLIRHGGQVIKVTSPTFPIGIVEEADTFARDFEFECGDIIIMFSDGINENEYKYIKELLMQNDNINQIVDEICTKANVFSESEKADDVTVIGLRLVR